MGWGTTTVSAVLATGSIKSVGKSVTRVRAAWTPCWISVDFVAHVAGCLPSRLYTVRPLTVTCVCAGIRAFSWTMTRLTCRDGLDASNLNCLPKRVMVRSVKHQLTFISVSQSRPSMASSTNSDTRNRVLTTKPGPSVTFTRASPSNSIVVPLAAVSVLTVSELMTSLVI